MVYLRQTLICYLNHIQLLNLFVKMKKFYPSTLYAISALCLSILSFSANAQAVPPATYTAVLGGDWHNTSTTAPGIWLTSEPPMNCVSCTIILNVPPNQTVNLNTHVVLSGNSTLTVGGNVSGTPNGTTLTINNSGATDTSHSYSINMMNDGTNNSIVVENNASSIIVSPNVNGAGNYDGLFSSTVTGGVVGSTKSIGYAPAGFQNGIITYTGAPQASSMTGFSTLSSTGTLPIVLSSFNVALSDGVVDLNWTTATESNSDHFSVQRSINAGASWKEIGTVEAAGNSNLPLSYSFVDSKPAQGTSEYRLQLIDRDGKYTYSDVKAITQGIVTGVNIYPNPAHDYVNITLSGTAGETMLIRLFNSAGTLLQEKNVANAGGTTVPIAVSSYPEGNYLIVVTAADGSRQINKLLITK